MNPPHLVEKSKKKKKDEKAKVKTQKADGLCTTCNNKPTCSYQKSRGPVMQCEEFDGYEATPRRVEPIAAPKGGDGNGKEGIQYKGLCVNCNHRAVCANAGLEGGVWYCENYE